MQQDPHSEDLDHLHNDGNSNDDRPFGWICTTTTARFNPGFAIYYGRDVYPNSSVDVQLHVYKVHSNLSVITLILLDYFIFMIFEFLQHMGII